MTDEFSRINEILKKFSIENLQKGDVFYKKENNKKFHLFVKKDVLIKMLRNCENKEKKLFCLNGEFLTSFETIKYLKGLDKKYVVFGNCDNQLEDGACGGHLCEKT